MLPAVYVEGAACAHRTSHDRGRLVLLVLEAGRTHLGRARTALEAADVACFAAELARAHQVIGELLASLEHASGGAAATSVGRLWSRLLRHLTIADAERSLARLDEVLAVYVPVADAFRQVVAGDGAA
jgi:flagellar biosynthetic protein FliS